MHAVKRNVKSEVHLRYILLTDLYRTIIYTV